MLNSRFAIDVYVESPSLPEAIAVPKYRPLCFAAAPSVLSAALAFDGPTSAVARPTAPTASASTGPRILRRMSDVGRAYEPMTVPPKRVSRMNGRTEELT